MRSSQDLANLEKTIVVAMKARLVEYPLLEGTFEPKAKRRWELLANSQELSRKKR